MLTCCFLRTLVVVGGCLWSAVEGPGTAQGRPKSSHPPDGCSTTNIRQRHLLFVIDQLQILYEDPSAALELLALLALIAVWWSGNAGPELLYFLSAGAVIWSLLQAPAWFGSGTRKRGAFCRNNKDFQQRCRSRRRTWSGPPAARAYRQPTSHPPRSSGLPSRMMVLSRGASCRRSDIPTSRPHSPHSISMTSSPGPKYRCQDHRSRCR